MPSAFSKARNAVSRRWGWTLSNARGNGGGTAERRLRAHAMQRRLCTHLFSFRQRGPCWAHRAPCPSRQACSCPAGTGCSESWSSVLGTMSRPRLRMGRAHWLYCFWADGRNESLSEQEALPPNTYSENKLLLKSVNVKTIQINYH